MINQIIFDLDNTLYDYSTPKRVAEGKVLFDISKYFGLSLDKITRAYETVLKKLEYKSNWYNFYKPFYSKYERYYLILKELRQDEAFAQILVDIFNKHFFNNIRININHYELLKELKKSYSLILLTDGLVEVQNLKIDKLGIKNLFDRIIITEEIGFSKSHKGLTDYLITNYDFQELAIVGDDYIKDIFPMRDKALSILVDPENKQFYKPKISSILELSNFFL